MKTQIKKWNYGNYSSNNYGAHSTALDIGNLTLYFSYDTVVAFSSINTGLVVCENVWGQTTGKHLNWIHENKNIRIPAEDFNKKLSEVLEKHGLKV